MSPEEAPIITSTWPALFVTGFISWQRICDLVNNILINGSVYTVHKLLAYQKGIAEGTLVAEDKSNHSKALLTFANAKRPSELRSCNLLCKFSCGMTRDMNDELLFTMLVFGFRLFVLSFPTGGDNDTLPSPNTGLFPYVLVRNAGAGTPSLPVSSDLRGSFSLSLML